jgi:predicted metal-dependent hydrolase
MSHSDLYQKGIEHFNAHEFFECHEVLEELWLQNPGKDKLFYQGIIQMAVAFYHYENANYQGALKLLQGSINKLTSYLPEHRGIDVQRLIAQLELWKKKFNNLIHGREDPYSNLEIPTLRFC